MATKAIRATKQNAKRETEVSEAQIAAHWKEEEVYYPPKKFIQQANLTDPKVMTRFSEKNFPKCYEEYAKMLT